MWRRFKWPVVLALLVVVAVAFRGPGERYFEVARSLDIFATLFKEVNAYYVDEVEPGKLIRTGIDAMLASLDPYTDYISEEEIESFRISTTGQYGGVGAMIGIVNGKVVITQPYRGFPAFTSGLHVGDELVAIDGVEIRGKRTSEVSALLKGQPGTPVEIKIRRHGKKEPFAVRVVRKRINISNVAHYSLVGSNIAYIRLDDFTPGASQEVAEALEELKSRGATRLILDLRENPGGLLHEAVNIVNLFVPKGLEVVSTRGKVEEWNKVYRTLNNPIDVDIPIVVLTSSGSASASEIVAGTLQDYDRAVLVGQKTFGKGLVQTTRPLSYNGKLKVTTAKYFIPSGRCIQALDYTHRRPDGTVVRIADSLKTEYHTKNGRVVYDGGGLDPDVKVEVPHLGAVTAALVDAGLIFEYASRYANIHPSPTDINAYRLTDEEYEDFTRWLKTQRFSYTTTVERRTRDLIETARSEKLYGALEAHLQGLSRKIEESKADDFVRFGDEIRALLEEQIAFHYDLEKGRSGLRLARDENVQTAVKLLADTAAYRRIFQPI